MSGVPSNVSEIGVRIAVRMIVSGLVGVIGVLIINGRLSPWPQVLLTMAIFLVMNIVFEFVRKLLNTKDA
jgi:hypothetical protein